MNRLHLIDRIEFRPDPETISTRLRLGELAGALNLEGLLSQAARIAMPRAAWALFEPAPAGKRQVVIAGERLTSRILRVNLRDAERVALFVATCGPELESWSEGFDDPLERWVTDEICEEALRSAVVALEAALDNEIEGEYRTSMNPGSLEDWPLVEQGPLFRALALAGDVTRATGVELTGSFLMTPRKSLSGVRFASPRQFTNCMLCPRDDCAGRRMAYDPEQFERQYDGAVRGTLYAETCGCGHDAAG